MRSVQFVYLLPKFIALRSPALLRLFAVVFSRLVGIKSRRFFGGEQETGVVLEAGPNRNQLFLLLPFLPDFSLVPFLFPPGEMFTVLPTFLVKIRLGEHGRSSKGH